MMSKVVVNAPLVASALTASLIGLLVIWQLQKKKTYVRVGRVKKVTFYPFKSLKGVECDEIKVKKSGVHVNNILDRTFMLVDSKGTMVTRMEEPTLVFPNLKISGNELIITADNLEPLKLSIKQDISPDDKIISCSVIASTVRGVDCGETAAEWFCKYLNRSDVRVVQYSEALEKRFNDGRGALFGGKPKREVKFQNKDVVHIISTSSVEELNKMLDEPVSELNFRPNVLVEYCPPFSEDDWKFLTFPGGLELETTGPCNRCSLTTVNTVTGVKTNKEPLKSMRKFRIPKDKKLAKALSYAPCFGTLCRVIKPGSIRVGDDIHAVIEKRFEYTVKS